MGKPRGSGSTKIQETEEQRAAAEVASKQWSLYQELKPLENLFMEETGKLNSESRYDSLAGEAGLGYQQQFGMSRQQAAQQLTSAGVDPGSGRFQGVMDSIRSAQMTGQTDTVSRAQVSQADKYVAGLQDVVATGAGQKAGALAGFSGLAENSLRRAVSDAQAARARQQGNSALIGTGLGAAGAYASRRWEKAGERGDR